MNDFIKKLKDSNQETDLLDTLTSNELAAYKEYPFENTFQGGENFGEVVALGDSWFDYPIGTDIIDCLRVRHDMTIINLSRFGDTLENMILGNSIDNNGVLITAKIHQATRKINHHNSKIFLFSGGGNDIVDENLNQFINHSSISKILLRDITVDYIFNTVFKNYLENMIIIFSEKCPNTKIFMHGYGYAQATGKGAGILWLNVSGPWILPYLLKKGIGEQNGNSLIKELIDAYNNLLADLDGKYTNFIYVDLRNIITVQDWSNELHLKNSAYANVADEIHKIIKTANLL